MDNKGHSWKKTRALRGLFTHSQISKNNDFSNIFSRKYDVMNE